MGDQDTSKEDIFVTARVVSPFRSDDGERVRIYQDRTTKFEVWVDGKSGKVKIEHDVLSKDAPGVRQRVIHKFQKAIAHAQTLVDAYADGSKTRAGAMRDIAAFQSAVLQISDMWPEPENSFDIDPPPVAPREPEQA